MAHNVVCLESRASTISVMNHEELLKVSHERLPPDITGEKQFR